jgi:hypothetical protein
MSINIGEKNVASKFLDRFCLWMTSSENRTNKVNKPIDNTCLGGTSFAGFFWFEIVLIMGGRRFEN